MRGLSIHLEIEEAATLTSSVERENVVDTYDHIPGSSIRGAIAGKYIKKNSVDADFARRFLHGVRFRYALPGSNGVRSSAIPLSWMSCKYAQEHGGVDRVHVLLNPERYNEQPWLCDQPGCGAQRETQPGWMTAEDPDVAPRVGAYTRSANEDGVAVEGRLYTTRQIDRRQEFIAELWGPNPEEILEAAGAGIGSILRVGRSRSTNGWLRITSLSEAQTKPVPEESDYVKLVMRTPTILRDPWLRPTRLPVIEGYRVAEVGIWTAWTTLFGWNSAASLPKTPDVAIGLGSTILLVRDDEPADPSAGSPVTLEQAAHEGLGLRRSEGFGEVDLFDAQSGIPGVPG